MDNQKSSLPMLCLTSLLILSSLVIFFFAPLTDTASFSAYDSLLTWVPVTDLSTNAYFPWRFNPILLSCSAWGGFPTYVLLLCFVFFLGWVQLGKSLNTPLFKTAGSSLAILFIVVNLFGINVPLLSLMSAAPWLMWIMIKSESAYLSTPFNLLIFLVSLFLSLLVNQLGILLALWGMVFFLLFSSEKNNRCFPKKPYILLHFATARSSAT